MIRRLALALALAGVVIAPAVSLVRYYDDPRYGGDEAHWSLLRQLETAARPGDAIISHDESHTNFYLNYSHATAPWYGVPRESLPLSPETATLAERLTRERRRVWLILPHTPPGDPGSGVERWLAEHVYPATDTAFGRNLRLASFAVPGGDLAWREDGTTLDDAVRLEAYALPDAPPATSSAWPCAGAAWPPCRPTTPSSCNSSAPMASRSASRTGGRPPGSGPRAAGSRVRLSPTATACRSRPTCRRAITASSPGYTGPTPARVSPPRPAISSTWA